MYDLLQLLVQGVLAEPLLHGLAVVVGEALHATALAHDIQQSHDFLLVLPQVLQAGHHQELEVLEDARLLALHQFHVVLGQLEGSFFEVKVAGRVGNHEAEVDVDEVAHVVDQYVIVVAILHKKQILKQRVPSQAAGEVDDRCLPVLSVDLLVYGPQ